MVGGLLFTEPLDLILGIYRSARMDESWVDQKNPGKKIKVPDDLCEAYWFLARISVKLREIEAATIGSFDRVSR